MENLTEEQQTEIGNQLIELLGLKVKKNGRVDTSVGDKTPLGLARTVNRVIFEKRVEVFNGTD